MEKYHIAALNLLEFQVLKEETPTTVTPPPASHVVSVLLMLSKELVLVKHQFLAPGVSALLLVGTQRTSAKSGSGLELALGLV